MWYTPCPSLMCGNNTNERNALNNVRGLQYSVLQPVPISVLWNMTLRSYICTKCFASTFKAKIPWRWRQKTPPKRKHPYTYINCDVYLKTKICINKSRTTNLCPKHFSLYTFHIVFQCFSLPIGPQASATTLGPGCWYQVSNCNLLNSKQKLITPRSKGTAQLFSVHGIP